MTNYPTTLDTFNNPNANTAQNAPGFQHDVQHANLNDAVAALQAKVGVNNSTAATSLDYRIGQLEDASGVVSVNGQSGTVVLTSDNLTEGDANLYFTVARARAAVSVSAPLDYNSATGVIAIARSGLNADGYLSQTDWNTFNGKQAALGFVPLDIAGSNAMNATLAVTPAVNGSALLVNGYSLTGANTQPMLDLSGTWNTTGEPTAIKFDLTDTNSSRFAVLLDLRVNGNSMFNVTKIGELSATYYLNTAGQFMMSGVGGNLYLYYPASNHDAITADDEAQTLTFTETGSNFPRARLTAYQDFVFLDSTNGNQPVFSVNGDGSGVFVSTVFGNLSNPGNHFQPDNGSSQMYFYAGDSINFCPNGGNASTFGVGTNFDFVISAGGTAAFDGTTGRMMELDSGSGNVFMVPTSGGCVGVGIDPNNGGPSYALDVSGTVHSDDSVCVTSDAGTVLSFYNDDNYGGSCIEMDGDEFGGPIRLRLTDHNGSNGAVFERDSDAIVDFIFLVRGSTGVGTTQENLRFENRQGFTTMGYPPEFRFGSDDDGWYAAISAQGIYTSGVLWFDGMNTGGPPYSNGNPQVNTYYGGNYNFLGDPDVWLYVNIDGNLYRMPLYS